MTIRRERNKLKKREDELRSELLEIHASDENVEIQIFDIEFRILDQVRLVINRDKLEIAVGAEIIDECTEKRDIKQIKVKKV